MADKRDTQPQDDRDAEHVEDGLGKLFEDASRRYRVYRELHDPSKLIAPAPLPEHEEPPTPERPLFVTSFEQLFNYGKEYSKDHGDAQP